MKALGLFLLYGIAIALPLLASALAGGPPRPVRDEIASAAGMLAFSIILVEFVLSGRFKTVTNGVGMDVTMRVHQLMARTALGLALIHPFLYHHAPTGGARPWDPTRQLAVTGDFGDLWSGILAFVLLPSLVLFGIWRKGIGYRYETWRAMHGVGALIIAGALLHHTLEAGRYGAEPELVWLWSAMTGLAGLTLVWVYVVTPLKDSARPWRVARVTRLSPAQWELVLAPDGHEGLDYRAGQFAWLTVGRGPQSFHENPFSIASAPSSGKEVSFIIKELGDFTRTVGEIAPGTRAYLDAPYGSLTVEGRTEPGIGLIAGGVGIAPLLGILRELRLRGETRPVRLVYGNRVESQIVARWELDGEDVVYVLSEPSETWTGETGLIDGALMERVFSDAECRDWLFVMCGPAPMMDGVEDHLIARGTPSSRILSERFDYD